MGEVNDDIIQAQEAELRGYADRRASRFIAYLEQARKDIVAEINALADGVGPDTPTSTRTRLVKILKRLDEIKKEAQDNILSVGSSDEYIAKLTKKHMEANLLEVVGTAIALPLDEINPRLLSLFAQNELEKVSSMAANQISVIKSALIRDVGAKGLNPRTIAKDLAGHDSGLFTGMYGRLQTIVRTESATVYNEQIMESIKYSVKQGAELRMKISEHPDDSRNHPISQVINNQVREVGETFRAKVSEVKATAARLASSSGRKVSKSLGRSVFWPVVGDYYVGRNLPAHYNERGRLVPTQKEVTP